MPLFTRVSGVLSMVTSITTIDTGTIDSSGTAGGSYVWEFSLSEVTAGTACSAGSVQLRIHRKDAFSGQVYSTGDPVAVFPGGAGSAVTSMQMLISGPNITYSWYGSNVFRAGTGTAVTFDIYQSIASAGCTTIPTFQYSLAVFKRTY
jgi:hypothetical protein